jgi:hypothetical protein
VAAKVFKGVTMVRFVLEEVDDLFVGDVDYGRALSKKLRKYWRNFSPCSCLTIAKSMRVPEHPMAPVKLLVN